MCSCTKNKVGKIPKISTSGLVPALAILGGVIAANYADKLLLSKVAVLNSPIAKGAAKGAIGLYLMSNKNQMVKGIGTGMVVNAGLGIVNNALPATTAGLLPVPGLRGIQNLREAAANAATRNYASTNVVYEG